MGNTPPNEADQARIAWEAQQDNNGAHDVTIAKLARTFYRVEGWTTIVNGVEAVNTTILQDHIDDISIDAVVDDPTEINVVGVSRAEGMAKLFPSLPEYDSEAWHNWDDDSRAAWYVVAAEVWRHFGNASSKATAANDGFTLVKTPQSKDAVARVYVTKAEEVVLSGPAAMLAAKAIKEQEKFAKAIGVLAKRHPEMLPALEKMHKKTLRLGKDAADRRFDDAKAIVESSTV